MTIRDLLEQMGVDVAGKQITVDGRPIDDIGPVNSDTDAIRYQRADDPWNYDCGDPGCTLAGVHTHAADAPTEDLVLAGQREPDDRSMCGRCDEPIWSYGGNWMHAPHARPRNCPRAVLIERCGEPVGAGVCMIPTAAHATSKHDCSPIAPVPGVDHDPDWAIRNPRGTT